MRGREEVKRRLGQERSESVNELDFPNKLPVPIVMVEIELDIKYEE